MCMKIHTQSTVILQSGNFWQFVVVEWIQDSSRVLSGEHQPSGTVGCEGISWIPSECSRSIVNVNICSYLPQVPSVILQKWLQSFKLPFHSIYFSIHMYISAGIFTRCNVVYSVPISNWISSILPLLIYSILIDSYIDSYTIPIVMWTFCHCDHIWSSQVTMVKPSHNGYTSDRCTTWIE